MFYKKILPALVSLSLAMMACSFADQLVTPATDIPQEPSTSQAPATVPARSLPTLRDIRPVLDNLGGQPCEESPDFTCVTVQVPLNHFDSANTETLGVVFAVLPASGERYGMYL